MSDYRVDAATKEEWAERALKAEAKLKKLQSYYGKDDDPCDEMMPPPNKK